MPAAHTVTRAAVLKRKVFSADLRFDGETAGGVSVGFRGGRNGVAGERCVASMWLLEKREWREEMDPRAEPRAEGWSASAIVGRLWGMRDERSVGSSSSTASSSIPGVGLSTGASDRVKPR